MNPESSQLMQQGIAALQDRDAGVAAKCFSQVLDQDPGNVEALHAMASIHHSQGDIDSAARLLEKIIEIHPENAAAQNNLGILYQSSGESKKARVCYRNAINAHRAFPEAWTNLGASMLMDNMHNEAEKCLGMALEIAPGYADPHFNLGKLYQARGDDQKAIAALHKTLEIQPAYAPAIAALAALYDLNGETEAALELLENARVAGHVSPEVALTFARVSGRRGNMDIAKDLAASVAQAQQLPGHVRAEAEFVLGDLFDRSKAWEQAVEHYRIANSLKPRRFDTAAHDQRVAQLIDSFTADVFDDFHASSNVSEAPVFILGLPRSGKSCVEQLLASHPEVSGLGEFRFLRQAEHLMRKELDSQASDSELLAALDKSQLDRYATDYLADAESVNGSAVRYLDNLPTNFLRVPLIRQLFPRARFIECTRRQDDNALYCFFKNFSAAGMDFATDPAAICHYIASYAQLVDHWKAITDLKWIEVRYEDLVNDTERVARELTRFLDIEWDPRCLAYADPGVARLAEPPAVRGPFDSREIGHAAHYEGLLDLPSAPAERP